MTNIFLEFVDYFVIIEQKTHFSFFSFSRVFFVEIQVCYGDAGGPAVVFDDQTKKPTLVGLIGWGRPCAHKAYPDVYSRVSAIRNWIRTQTSI